MRNLFTTRTLSWREVVDVRFAGGDPWVTLALSDTDTLAVMAIQKADGDSAAPRPAGWPPWSRPSARRRRAPTSPSTERRRVRHSTLRRPGRRSADSATWASIRTVSVPQTAVKHPVRSRTRAHARRSERRDRVAEEERHPGQPRAGGGRARRSRPSAPGRGRRTPPGRSPARSPTPRARRSGASQSPAWPEQSEHRGREQQHPPVGDPVGERRRQQPGDELRRGEDRQQVAGVGRVPATRGVGRCEPGQVE